MRFLLVTEARSGTHMLRSVFLNHSSIQAFVDYNADLLGIPEALPKYLSEMYSNVPLDNIAGAFTHFGEVQNQSISEPAGWVRKDWQTLRVMHDYVIVLTRRNKLRQFLSRQLLRLQGFQDWDCAQPRTKVQEPIKFNLKEYFADLVKTQEIVRSISCLLEPYHHVYYEDLVSDWQGTVQGIYTYLKLEWNDPTLTTYLQETRPINRVISNWQDVVAELSGLEAPSREDKILLRQLQNGF